MTRLNGALLSASILVVMDSARIVKLLLVLGALVGGILAAKAEPPARTRAKLDSQWCFQEGDPAGAEQAGFDDRSWQTVELPHDWAVDQPINEANPRYLKDLNQVAHEEDPSRPTAFACEGNADANANGFALVTDVMGYNGGGMGIDDRDHRLYPQRKMLVSEFSSGRGARGVYEEKVLARIKTEKLGDGRTVTNAGQYFSTYDLCRSHEAEWSHIAQRPWLAGGAMWSGIDYAGETCGWPMVTSQFGVLDRCRFPNDAYQPGTLSARALKNGKVICTDEIKTAGAPARIKLLADRNAIGSDGCDLSFITVRILDDQGTVVPVADNQVAVSIEGPGRLLGLCSGDPASHENPKAGRMKVFNGLLLAIPTSTLKNLTWRNDKHPPSDSYHTLQNSTAHNPGTGNRPLRGFG